VAVPDIVSMLASAQPRSRRRIPVMQQLGVADCGAACLAMVLAYHGRAVPLDEVSSAVGSTLGSNAAEIMRAAQRYGLRARGVEVSVDAVRYLPRGSILHWGFTHFVLLERARRSSVDIVDPAIGRRRMTHDRFRRLFTGVALIFEPTAEFVSTPAGPSRSRRYWSYLLAHRRILLRVIATSIVLRLFALSLPLLTAVVIDRVVPQGDHGMLAAIGFGAAIILLVQLSCLVLRSHMLTELRTVMDSQMTVSFVSHLLSLPYAYFNQRSAGDLILRVRSNSEIRELLTSSLLSTLLDGGLAVGYLVMLFALSPMLAALTVVLGSLHIAVLLATRKRFAQLASQDLETQARAHGQLLQMITGIETIKIAGAEDRALEQWATLYSDELNVSLARSRMLAITDAIDGVLRSAAPLALLGAGALLVIDGALSLGAMLATITLASNVLVPLSSLFENARQFQLFGSHIERLEDVLSAEPEQRPGVAPSPPRLRGAIELQQLSFRYGAGAQLVVRDVDLRIEPGTMLAIVGRTGSGKSTLLSLLLGLYAPTGGRILYDGVDLASVDRRQLRQQLGVVPQNPFIFAGTVRSNIAIAEPSIGLDQVIAAARLACVDDDIRAMAMGYETPVAARGATLSGGQRQRIALARTLLTRPAILMLDEATSSLDATTERQILDNLRDVRATRIVVAHRLSSIAHADNILVMDDGRIVETGTHDELMAKAGVYAALFADQAVLERDDPAALVRATAGSG
jgi:ATP-binding cassette, subfamily B, bacterial